MIYLEEGKNLEPLNEVEDENVNMKDSQTVIIKDTVKIEIRNVPIELKNRYMNYARKYCKGNWTYALARMLDAAEMTPQFNLLVEKIGEVELQLNEHMNEGNKEEEVPEKKVPKTFAKEE